MKFIKNVIRTYFKEIMIAAVLASIIIYIISHYLFYFALIPSESMVNTLLVGDRIYVSKTIYPLQKGDIYTFKHDNKLMIKRLIGTSGDIINIVGNDVYVNDVLLEEPYVSSSIPEDSKLNLKFEVPEGKCFFLGDNRRYSIDSRYWSDPYVDEDDIDGKAIKIVSPNKRKANL